MLMLYKITCNHCVNVTVILAVCFLTQRNRQTVTCSMFEAKDFYKSVTSKPSYIFSCNNFEPRLRLKRLQSVFCGWIQKYLRFKLPVKCVAVSVVWRNTAFSWRMQKYKLSGWAFILILCLHHLEFKNVTTQRWEELREVWQMLKKR